MIYVPLCRCRNKSSDLALRGRQAVKQGINSEPDSFFPSLKKKIKKNQMRQKFCSHVKASPLFYVIEAFHDFIPILETGGTQVWVEARAVRPSFRESVSLSVCRAAVTYEGPGRHCGIIGLLGGESSRAGGLFGRHANLSRTSSRVCCSSLYTHMHAHEHTPPGGLRAARARECVRAGVCFTPTPLRSTSPLLPPHLPTESSVQLLLAAKISFRLPHGLRLPCIPLLK